MKPLRRILGVLAAAVRRPIKWMVRTRRQQKRFRQYRKAFRPNDLLRATPNSRYPQDTREFWRKHYGKDINPFWHVACANVTGQEDVRYVPTYLWFDEILPFFNKMSMRPAYVDKNLSDVLLGPVHAPATIVRRMHGRYYRSDNEWISRDAALAEIKSGGPEQIIKPSLTDNGVGIGMLQRDGERLRLNGADTTLEALESSHGGDFIIQSRIRQHPTMAAPHPSSVNTVRLVTFRWNDEIRPLLSFARFGTAGKLTDNAGTGGVCCGIGEGGRLNATAVDEFGTVHTHHPTSGYDFGLRAVVPNYDLLCERALALHRRIVHFDIVSWDFAVDEHAEPVFLEFNLRGAVYIYQFASGKPVFGELTQAVLGRIRDSGYRRCDEDLAS
jgi:hypothetical protein